MHNPEQERDLKSLFQVIREEDARLAPAFERICGTSSLNGFEFVTQFEQCRLPSGQWKHGDHLRLGWCYVRCFGPTEAEERIARSLRAYTASLGAEDKYHETVTRAWLRLIVLAHSVMPLGSTFEVFVNEHAWLLDRKRLNVFYSAERLESGRNIWIEPDLRSLPSSAASPSERLR
jgi:hypothetical protein